jgi:hypothetical protein
MDLLLGGSGTVFFFAHDLLLKKGQRHRLPRL